MALTLPMIWNMTCHNLGLPKNNDVLKDIIQAYNEKTRYYHSIAHLEYCVKTAQSMHKQFYYPYETIMALFFHDFVYDTHDTDINNVLRSADICENYLREMYSDYGRYPNEDVISMVKSNIMATTHTDGFKTYDQSLIMDIDISMMAQFDPQVIEGWIQSEYKWVPKEKYQRARKDILKQLYMKNTLYNHPLFQRKFETKTKNCIYDMIIFNNPIIALGGTFDLLHVGHERLINYAFSLTHTFVSKPENAHVYIGLTSDKMASKKSHPVQPFKVRARQIEDLISSMGYRTPYTIIPLDDPLGDLGTNPDYDILVASEESRNGAEYVNKIREENGLVPVILDIINVVTDRNGERISSTKLREMGEK